MQEVLTLPVSLRIVNTFGAAVQAENYARNFLGAIFVTVAMEKASYVKISHDTIRVVKQRRARSCRVVKVYNLRAMPCASRFEAKAFEGCAMMAKSFQFENLKQNSGERLACPVRVARAVTRKSTNPLTFALCGF